MIETTQLTAGQWAALLHFYADAGVEALVDDEPVDRIAEFAASRSQPATPARQAASSNSRQPATARPAPRAAAASAMAIPGEEAVQMARKVADSAADIAALKASVEQFEGCNLRASARNTVFPSAMGSLPLLIFGPAPSADDDREGRAFSGIHGDLLAKMFAAIDIDVTQAVLAHAVPWRPPGGRPPTPAEAEICRPFAMRLIQLVRPRFIVMLGNFAARFFTGSSEAIHGLRGEWFEIGDSVEALAMLHPQDLIAAPPSKSLAWRDLLALEARLREDRA